MGLGHRSAALAASGFPQNNARQVHSIDVRLIEIAPLVLDLGGKNRIATGVAWRAASIGDEHLGRNLHRQGASVDFAQDHFPRGRGIHGTDSSPTAVAAQFFRRGQTGIALAAYEMCLQDYEAL